MASAEKPRHRDGYSREETAQVESACLSIAVTLGALMDNLCIVGGLVPTLLIDHGFGETGAGDDRHPGTLDLDVGLALALLDERQYAAVSARLRQEGFGADENELGNPTPQRWKRHSVTVDFLLPQIPGAQVGGRVHALEADFGALIAPGLEVAFDERCHIALEGHTLIGERATRTVPVCGPGAFVVLKALAFGDRAEPKDAFDLVYTLRRWPEGVEEIAGRLAQHALSHNEIVHAALALLERDFGASDLIGPLRAAEFERATGELRDELAADARGHVDDLLTACRERGLAPSPQPAA